MTDTAGGDDPHDELRERLLQAAAAVFARNGYAGTKVMDIVREAGLSTGAMYGRFRSKNELLREAVVGRSTRVGYIAAEAASLAELFDYPARSIGRPLTDAEAMRLEAYVTARREPDVAAAVADAYAAWREKVEPLVASSAIDGGLADGVDAEAALLLFRAIYFGLLLHRGAGLTSPEPQAWTALLRRVTAAVTSPHPGGAVAGGGDAAAPA
ncbi:hypothetical protein PSU4_20870 [Pseudonocardia sulfidoxydans NBRC 16205]|uniref:HTH tetR-type domain-containing protein n=1 Tax=Pseudonocardia sulfidoxydans NBRC 16205 TaxID=1223511 RepID=A0A511DFE8_9PSEU|nr:TetR/AcrR family transcriptional regulator [Pseudonocardia sulfidoxydans]GEL23133.1 hypothetical protein PSU4_20870 [Pseudonocardia sulfidoxydans NBRC 16205]